MTAPAAGVVTGGVGGAFALKSTNSGGTIRYIPFATFNASILRGDDTVPLVNNVGYAANEVDGVTTCDWSLQTPLIPTVLVADFWARAFGSTYGDTDASNYHTLTHWPDGAGSAARVYALAKFATCSGAVRFSRSGTQSSATLTFGGPCADPLSGSVAALTAPASGALSAGKIIGYAKTAFTGATQVVGMGFQLATGADYTAGTNAGTNADYPVLPKGILMPSGLVGTVTLTQYQNATTVLGVDGTAGAFTVAFGSTGAGISMAFRLKPRLLGMPSNLGPNYQTNSYYLQSVDGTTSPFVVTDL